MWNSRKSKFSKWQDTKGLLSGLWVRTPLSKIPLLGPLLFCESFAINKEIIKKIKQTRDSRHIYQNELDRVCFQHDVVYGDIKV